MSGHKTASIATGSSGNQSEIIVPEDLENAATSCIIEELNSIYECRLQDIDEQAKGDYKLKCVTYKEWVETLMRTMNHMLRTLHDLENEASKRIGLLEKKLKIECTVDHNTEVSKVKSDLANLLELIRRAIEDKRWNCDGLEFKTITTKDIFGDPVVKGNNSVTNELEKLNSQIVSQNQHIKKLESEKNTLKTELDAKELQLRKLNLVNCKCKTDKPETKTDNKIDLSKVIAPDEILTKSLEDDKVFKTCITELRREMKEKEERLAKTLKENECLKSELTLVKSQMVQKDKVITNIRALTIEVADKHDQIQQMRTQMFSLEEDLKKAEKKIQFKDNVIKELRRDCKNASKNCTCSKRSTSPGGRSPSPEKSLCWPKTLSSPRAETSLMSSNCSDYTVDTIVALESHRLQSCQAEESQRFQTLQKELQELFSIHSDHAGSIEDQRRMVCCQQKRVQELVQQLLHDLHKTRNKLTYIRHEMITLTSPGGCDSSGFDSGYNSPEDMEPEGSIIRAVKNKMQYLHDENHQLIDRLRLLENDVHSFKSTASNCGKVLREVASTISMMLRKEVQCDYEKNGDCEGNPLCDALDSLKSDLYQKNNEIEQLTKINRELEKELQCSKSTNCAIQHETNAKEQTIYEFQETIDFQNNSIKVLQDIKDQLECELSTVRDTDVHKKLTQLLNDKAKLESECQNQLTTISNLRQALESVKRGTTGAVTSTSSGPTSGGSNSSLWGWWRNSVHDV